MNLNGFDGAWLIQPALWAAAAIAFVILLRLANIFRYIPNNQVGIVEKLWSTRGSIDEGFIALNGEAGYEPEVLRGGLHVFFPFMYRIHKSDLVTVGQGKIAYVFARDGARLALRRCLAPTTPTTSRTFRTRGDSCSLAGRRDRSEKSCAKVPMRSTPRSSRSSPTIASTVTP